MAAEAIDRERERLLAQFHALNLGATTDTVGTSMVMAALVDLNQRCEALRVEHFPQAAALSIAAGRATTWSSNGLMRTVWRKTMRTETGLPDSRIPSK